jgi:hypothetical protein
MRFLEKTEQPARLGEDSLDDDYPETYWLRRGASVLRSTVASQLGSDVYSAICWRSLHFVR